MDKEKLSPHKKDRLEKLIIIFIIAIIFAMCYVVCAAFHPDDLFQAPYNTHVSENR